MFVRHTLVHRTLGICPMPGSVLSGECPCDAVEIQAHEPPSAPDSQEQLEF
jgi:hypothetical protein